MRLFLITSCLFFDAATCQTTYGPAVDFDFGAIRQGTRARHVFTLKNTGLSPIQIEKIDIDTPGVTARFSPAVAPGAEGKITLEWNTSRAEGEVRGTATLYTNDSAVPQRRLTFKALIQPPIEFRPYPAVYFTAYADQSPEKMVRIINHEDQPLRITRIDAPKRLNVSLAEVRPGREFELRVRVQSGGPLGRTSEPIILITDSAARPTLDITANVFVKADLYAFPENISFGVVNRTDLAAHPGVLAMLAQSTVITNREGPFELESITSDLPFIRVSREPQSGASQRFLLTLEFDPAALKPGEFRGSVEIRTKDPRHTRVTLPVTLEVR